MGRLHMSQPLLIEHNDGVDTVTLNRPESLNALDPALIDALNVYFQGLQRNRDTCVVVLKGAGKNFCAGLDLKAAMQRRAGQQGGRRRLCVGARLRHPHRDEIGADELCFHQAGPWWL
jgi:enoyl-CoA hydratase/carnithine racemase